MVGVSIAKGALGLGAFASRKLASMAAFRSGSSSSSSRRREDDAYVCVLRSTNGGSEVCHDDGDGT